MLRPIHTVYALDVHNIHKFVLEEQLQKTGIFFFLRQCVSVAV